VTDALQCVMLVIGGVVLFFLALDHIPRVDCDVRARPSGSTCIIRRAIRKRRSWG